MWNRKQMSNVSQNIYRLIRWVLFFVSALLPITWGVEITPVGVIGNSGEVGDSLITLDIDGINSSRSAAVTGVAVDREGRVWFGIGRSLAVTDLDGNLLATHSLPRGYHLSSRTFTLLDSRIYFWAREIKDARKNGKLMAVDVATGNISVIELELPELFSHRYGLLLAPQPMNGKLVVGFTTYKLQEDIQQSGRVCLLDPATWKLRTLVQLSANQMVNGLAADPMTRTFFVGGYFGKYVPAMKHHPRVHEVVEYDLSGKELRRTDAFNMEAIPSQFRGVVSYAGGAVWDTAWYGFLGRYDRGLTPSPGKIMAWNMVLPQPQQVYDLAEGLGIDTEHTHLRPLLITNTTPGEVFYAVWDERSRELDIQRRIGALSGAHGVGLSNDGWIFYGRHWWRWEDRPDTPPRFGNVSETATNGTFEPKGNRFCSLITKGGKEMGCTFSPATARASGRPTNRALPILKPGGFVIKYGPEGTNNQAVGFATSATDGTIWQCAIEDRTWATLEGSWKLLPVYDPTGILSPEAENPLDTTAITNIEPARKDSIASAAVKVVAAGILESPGDVVLWKNGLLVAGEGEIIFLAFKNDGLEVRKRIRSWQGADGEEDHFGSELHLAAENGLCLITDSARHRVLLFTDMNASPVAQFGETDHPGRGPRQLTRPTKIAINGDHVLVVDAGNRRMVKCVLER